MTDLILDWLNNKVKLSNKILSIDEDFSNGYYYAELFFKFNKIQSLEKFIKNTSSPLEKNHNFMQLDKVFKDFNIRLTEDELKKMKSSKRNSNKKIIYLIKYKLDQYNISIDNINLKNNTFLHKEYKKFTFCDLNFAMLLGINLLINVFLFNQIF